MHKISQNIRDLQNDTRRLTSVSNLPRWTVEEMGRTSPCCNAKYVSTYIGQLQKTQVVICSKCGRAVARYVDKDKTSMFQE